MACTTWLVLNETQFQSLSALENAHPSYTVDKSAHIKISDSPAWKNTDDLPNDAASTCTSQLEYEKLALELNNATFCKLLTLTGSTVCWNGMLALYSTKQLVSGSEVLATRGWEYWGQSPR